MFASAIQLVYPKRYNSIGENGDEIEKLKLGRLERTVHRIWIVRCEKIIRGMFSVDC